MHSLRAVYICALSAFVVVSVCLICVSRVLWLDIVEGEVQTVCSKTVRVPRIHPPTNKEHVGSVREILYFDIGLRTVQGIWGSAPHEC